VRSRFLVFRPRADRFDRWIPQTLSLLALLAAYNQPAIITDTPQEASPPYASPTTTTMDLPHRRQASNESGGDSLGGVSETSSVRNAKISAARVSRYAPQRVRNDSTLTKEGAKAFYLEAMKSPITKPPTAPPNLPLPPLPAVPPALATTNSGLGAGRGKAKLTLSRFNNFVGAHLARNNSSNETAPSRIELPSESRAMALRSESGFFRPSLVVRTQNLK
jgi:hypothetical protein